MASTICVSYSDVTPETFVFVFIIINLRQYSVRQQQTFIMEIDELFHAKKGYTINNWEQFNQCLLFTICSFFYRNMYIFEMLPELKKKVFEVINQVSQQPSSYSK